jgi:hypothetical protein
MDTKQKSEQNGCRVLTPATILQIDGKLAEAIRMRFAEVTLVVENGKLRFIRGPSPSEPVRN